MAPMYNFKLQAETIWLIGSTILGAVVVDVAGRLLEAADLIEAGTFPTVDTFAAWGAALLVTVIRTGVGALLAAVTGGRFINEADNA